MKKIRFSPGGQKIFNADLKFHQEEIFKAIENQYSDQGAFVFSGATVTGTTILAGLVYINGKILELATTSSLTFPCYIIEATEVQYDARLFTEDQQTKNTRINNSAIITSNLTVAQASGEYITVNTNGVSKRMATNFVDEKGVFANSGFALNKGKNTHIEATKQNAIIAQGVYTPITNYDEGVDELNEFNSSTGEFTASFAGVYQINARLNVVLQGNGGLHQLVLQFYDGSTWVEIDTQYYNVLASLLQSVVRVNFAKKMLAGQKIRLVTCTQDNLNYSAPASLTITRIG